MNPELFKQPMTDRNAFVLPIDEGALFPSYVDSDRVDDAMIKQIDRRDVFCQILEHVIRSAAFFERRARLLPYFIAVATDAIHVPTKWKALDGRILMLLQLSRADADRVIIVRSLHFIANPITPVHYICEFVGGNFASEDMLCKVHVELPDALGRSLIPRRLPLLQAHKPPSV